jgi:hypothetical protein
MPLEFRQSAQNLVEFRRPPEQVMRLARMGSAHPTRLSFLRAVLRRMIAEKWRFDRPVWDMDAKGVGRAVYRAIGPERTYSLVAFGHDLPDHMRSDRVIATAWDATFALFDGTPDADDLDRLAANVPLQEAGRVSDKELTLSRANRSVRLFHYVVVRLAEGLQPDPAELDAVGYLMRTTAVYGSGKFGLADRSRIADRPELSGPFRAEMLSVWLIRAFTVDLVEHLAAAQGGDKAVRLDPVLRRGLGVGNATGLGMAPFLVRHPILLNNWMRAREEALARVRARPSADPTSVAGLHAALSQAQTNAATWRSDHPLQQAKLADLRRDLTLISARIADFPQGHQPWNRLWLWAESNLSLEGQEALLAMMLEPHDDLIDDLADRMGADEVSAFVLDGSVPIGQFAADLARRYAWALDCDYRAPKDIARFWYVSEEKLEPRIGERFAEDGAGREQPLGIGRMAMDLAKALAPWRPEEPMASFLLAHPEHRQMVRRVQQSAHRPYAEIEDNLLAADMLPIDMLRCKLAFFGASHFDPRSDKWVRISLYKGEPFPADLNQMHGAMP